MDGVLLDSMGVWERIGCSYLEKQGKTPQPDLKQVLFTKSMMDSARYFREHYGIEKENDVIIAEIVAMIKEYYEKVIPAKAGVADFLSGLKKRGIKMAVATSSDKSLAMGGLAHNGLLEYMEGIISCRQVGVGKERPDVYEAAWKLLGCEKGAAWVFEDSLHGIRTAKKAGFPVVGIYDSASEKDQPQIKDESDCYLLDMTHLEEFMNLAQNTPFPL